MSQLIRELKIELKRRAEEIRVVRKASKEYAKNPEAGWTGPREYTPSWSAGMQYRHMHIAYCELRGRTREQIEPKVLPGNEPDDGWIRLAKEKGARAFDDLYPNGRTVIWKLDGKTWVFKTEANKHEWDHTAKDLKDLRERVEIAEKAVGQFGIIKDLVRKLTGVIK